MASLAIHPETLSELPWLYSLGMDPIENAALLLCQNGPERKPQFLRLLRASLLLRNVLPLLTFVGPQRARHTI
jgi:hypothetical protein